MSLYDMSCHVSQEVSRESIWVMLQTRKMCLITLICFWSVFAAAGCLKLGFMVVIRLYKKQIILMTVLKTERKLFTEVKKEVGQKFHYDTQN